MATDPVDRIAIAASVPRLPANPTPGQRWRWRRDLLIVFAVHHGFSHRFLADVFDLPRSRIFAIVKQWGDPAEWFG